jgi:predicted Zn finger-like uncharacterized protein
MIVSCPQCDTHFDLDPKVLMPNGRALRCAKCKHTWTERPPDDIHAPEPVVAPVAPVAPAATIAPAPAATKKPDPLASPESDLDSDVPDEIPDFDAELEVRAARRRDIRRKAAAPRKSGKKIVIAWGTLVAVVLIVLAGGFFGRTQITEIWAPAAQIYEMVGLAPAKEIRLEVINIRGAKRRTEDGIALDVTR